MSWDRAIRIIAVVIIGQFCKYLWDMPGWSMPLMYGIIEISILLEDR